MRRGICVEKRQTVRTPYVLRRNHPGVFDAFAERISLAAASMPS
jgi:hypothetical protein